MINLKNFEYSVKPFNHFVCDNFLDDNIFKKLKLQIDMMFMILRIMNSKTDIVERFDPEKKEV